MTRKTLFMVLAGCLLILCGACADCSAPGCGRDIRGTAESSGGASVEYNMGARYHRGEGIPQDYEKAREWYEKAAEKGEADAEYNLGVMYLYGQGVAKSKYIAKEWFGRACGHGDREACARHRHLNEQGF